MGPKADTRSMSIPVIPDPPVPPNYHRVSHAFHLLMSIITFGLWAIAVWPWWTILVSMSNMGNRQDYARKLAEYERAVHEYEHFQRRMYRG